MIAIYGAHDQQKELMSKFKQLSETGAVPAKAKTPGHKDGWGILTYDKGKPRYLGREPSDPFNGSGYDHAIGEIGEIQPQIILGHLRKASCGEHSIENTQPFLNSKWSFAHNGTIYSPGLKRIADENDSRAYFRTLLDTVRNPNIESALVTTMKKIRHGISLNSDATGQTYSSLTFLLTDGIAIYALRDFSDETERDYYTMYYRLFQNGIVFCQQKIIDGEWEEIPNKTLAAYHPDEGVKTIPCD